MSKLKQQSISKIFSALIVAGIALLILSTDTRAAVENPVIGSLGTSENVENGGKFIEYVVYLWRAAITLGGLAVILFFVLGAIDWITAGGDKGKIESARSRMTNSIIGLVLLVGSFTLLGFLSKLLFGDNFNILELTIPGIGVTQNQAESNSNFVDEDENYYRYGEEDTSHILN